MKGLAAEVVAGLALGLKLALDHHLGGDAGVVGARLPQGVVALHAVIADQRVHDRVLERVAHVQAAGDIRRRDHDAVGFAVARRGEIAGLFPGLVQAQLDGVRVVGLVERRGGVPVVDAGRGVLAHGYGRTWICRRCRRRAYSSFLAGGFHLPPLVDFSNSSRSKLCRRSISLASSGDSPRLRNSILSRAIARIERSRSFCGSMVGAFAAPAAGCGATTSCQHRNVIERQFVREGLGAV